MKLGVRIAIGLGLLLVLALGLLLIFAGPLVKGAIESGGTWATGVTTRVEDVSAGLLDGELGLEGLTVANPPGFGAAPFFSVRSASAGWENRSLFSDEVHVRELSLDGLTLRIERNAQGTNYGRILDHLKSRGGGGAAGPAAPEPAGAQRTLIVDRIVLSDLRAELALADVPVGAGSYAVSVPRFEITAFRSDGTTAEITGKLLAAIVESALDASLKAGQGTFPKELLADLEGRLGDLSAVQAQAQKALEKVDGELKKAGQALEGVGDLFKKKKP